MTATTTNPGNYVVEKTTVFKRIDELMHGYEGSERYYQTSRGYAVLADKLESEGFENVDSAIAIYRDRVVADRFEAVGNPCDCCKWIDEISDAEFPCSHCKHNVNHVEG